MGFVYFAESVPARFVKVGYSADPVQRMVALRQECNSMFGRGLKLVAVFIGTAADEMTVHGILSDYREQGEWYRDSEELRKVAAQLFTIPVAEFDRKPILESISGPRPELRECAICGHQWVRREGSDPKRCPAPHCRSQRWRARSLPIEKEHMSDTKIELKYEPFQD